MNKLKVILLALAFVAVFPFHVAYTAIEWYATRLMYPNDPAVPATLTLLNLWLKSRNEFVGNLNDMWLIFSRDDAAIEAELANDKSDQSPQ